MDFPYFFRSEPLIQLVKCRETGIDVPSAPENEKGPVHSDRPDGTILSADQHQLRQLGQSLQNLIVRPFLCFFCWMWYLMCVKANQASQVTQMQEGDVSVPAVHQLLDDFTAACCRLETLQIQQLQWDSVSDEGCLLICLEVKKRSMALSNSRELVSALLLPKFQALSASASQSLVSAFVEAGTVLGCEVAKGSLVVVSSRSALAVPFTLHVPC